MPSKVTPFPSQPGSDLRRLENHIQQLDNLAELKAIALALLAHQREMAQGQRCLLCRLRAHDLTSFALFPLLLFGGVEFSAEFFPLLG